VFPLSVPWHKVLATSVVSARSRFSTTVVFLFFEEYDVASGIDATKKRPIRGIGGRTMTIGCATIPIPLSAIGITIAVEFQISESNFRSVLSLADVERNMFQDDNCWVQRECIYQTGKSPRSPRNVRHSPQCRNVSSQSPAPKMSRWSPRVVFTTVQTVLRDFFNKGCKLTGR
jgi:hypothetical protein